MNKLKLLKIGAGVLIPLLLGLIGGCNVERSRVAKKLKAHEQVKFDTESELTAGYNIIAGLKLERAELKSNLKDVVAEVENLKQNPIIKKVPVTKYKTVEKIKYVKAQDYELTYEAYLQCEREKAMVFVAFKAAGEMFDRIVGNYEKTIVAYQDNEKTFKKRIEAADSTIKFLSSRYYSTMYLSLSVSAGGYYRIKHDMTSDYGFELLTIRLGFNKDIFRIALDR